MPYIGRSENFGVRSRFQYQATAGQTSFSGSDANSLSLSYTDSLYMDVYQNGILLVPGDDYTATTGTSVVLDTGATVSDSVQIVVYDVFSVADTVSKANGGTFESNISIGGTLGVTGNVISPVTIGGTTPTLTIGDAGAEDAALVFDGNAQDFYIALDDSADKLVIGEGSTVGTNGILTIDDDSVTIGDGAAVDTKLVFDGNAQDFHIGLDDSADSLTIGLGSTLGTTSHMVFDANGHITKPLQSAFLVGKSSQQSNIAVGQDVAITFDTEHFDQNGDFSSNTFTAPVTGKYQLNALVRLSNLDSASDYYYLQVVTSNRAYLSAIIDPDFGQDATYWQLSTSILADLDANDTASMKIVQHSGTQQTDLEGAAEHGTTFSGYLVA